MADTEHETKSTPGLMTEALNHVSALVRNEVDLARAEINENVRKAMTAVGLLVAAAVIALTALNVLAAALVAAIAEWGLEEGWAALIVGVIFGVIAFIMLSKGMNDLKASSLAPSRTTRNVKRDANTVKEAYDAR